MSENPEENKLEEIEVVSSEKTEEFFENPENKTSNELSVEENREMQETMKDIGVETEKIQSDPERRKAFQEYMENEYGGPDEDKPSGILSRLTKGKLGKFVAVVALSTRLMVAMGGIEKAHAQSPEHNKAPITQVADVSGDKPIDMPANESLELLEQINIEIGSEIEELHTDNKREYARDYNPPDQVDISSEIEELKDVLTQNPNANIKITVTGYASMEGKGAPSFDGDVENNQVLSEKELMVRQKQ